MVSSSLVAIDEETFNLDDLVEAKMKIEIPVGKGIPTSRIVKVGDLQRPVYFQPIPVSAGTRVGQQNEMRLLQRKTGKDPKRESPRPGLPSPEACRKVSALSE